MPDIRQTPTLSTFPGPAENPLSEGGDWDAVYTTDPLLKKNISGSIFGASNSAASGTNYSHWTDVFDDADLVEAWGIKHGGGAGAALDTHRVALWLADSVGPSDGGPDGYLYYSGGGIGTDQVLRRYTNFGFTDIATVSGGAEQYMLLRIDGDNIEAWTADDPSSWTMVLQVADTTHRGPWVASLGIEDNTFAGLAWLGFGGGVGNPTITPLPQYIRRPHRRGALWLP